MYTGVHLHGKVVQLKQAQPGLIHFPCCTTRKTSAQLTAFKNGELSSDVHVQSMT